MNMKKKYFAPTININVLETTSLLAGSIGEGKTVGSGQPESDVSTPGTSGDNQFSKKHYYNVWDNDEP